MKIVGRHTRCLTSLNAEEWDAKSTRHANCQIRWTPDCQSIARPVHKSSVCCKSSDGLEECGPFVSIEYCTSTHLNRKVICGLWGRAQVILRCPSDALTQWLWLRWRLSVAQLGAWCNDVQVASTGMVFGSLETLLELMSLLWKRTNDIISWLPSICTCSVRATGFHPNAAARRGKAVHLSLIRSACLWVQVLSDKSSEYYALLQVPKILHFIWLCSPLTDGRADHVRGFVTLLQLETKCSDCAHLTY